MGRENHETSTIAKVNEFDGTSKNALGSIRTNKVSIFYDIVLPLNITALYSNRKQ